MIRHAWRGAPKASLLLLSMALVGACSGSDSEGVATTTDAAIGTTTTSAPTTTTTTMTATTTTMAPGIDELANGICVDFSIEYAAAKDRGIVRSLFFNTDTRGYLLMIDPRDTPYANAIVRLEALAVSDPQVSPDAQRLIVALDDARQANAEQVEGNTTARRFADAMTALEDVADELGLTACGYLKIAEKTS